MKTILGEEFGPEKRKEQYCHGEQPRHAGVPDDAAEQAVSIVVLCSIPMAKACCPEFGFVLEFVLMVIALNMLLALALLACSSVIAIHPWSSPALLGGFPGVGKR